MSEPEKEQLSDLDLIRRYVRLANYDPTKVRRSKLLGTARAAAFSLPAKVISEMERQADLEGTSLSAFVFTAVVEKILTARLREKYGDDTHQANLARIRSGKGPVVGNQRNRKKRAGRD